jgi:hypothetical protein
VNKGIVKVDVESARLIDGRSEFTQESRELVKWLKTVVRIKGKSDFNALAIAPFN